MYDLEERTYQFARDVSMLCRSLSKDLVTREYISQLVRSSGSVGANYIEANEALSKKDFLMRIKIARKEAKESIFWLRLLKDTVFQDNSIITKLITEATELKKILSSIATK